jgi:hypothetical protein
MHIKEKKALMRQLMELLTVCPPEIEFIRPMLIDLLQVLAEVSQGEYGRL